MIKVMISYTVRIVGNIIGGCLDYGTCPNCGDSWLWKPSSAITFRRSGCGCIIREVMICSKCISNPLGLVLPKIRQSLIESQWPPDDIRMVEMAVVDYQRAR